MRDNDLYSLYIFTIKLLKDELKARLLSHSDSKPDLVRHLTLATNEGKEDNPQEC